MLPHPLSSYYIHSYFSEAYLIQLPAVALLLITHRVGSFQEDTPKDPTKWAPQKKQVVPPVRKRSQEELALERRAAEDLRMYDCDEWIDGDSGIRIRCEDVL